MMLPKTFTICLLLCALQLAAAAQNGPLGIPGINVRTVKPLGLKLGFLTPNELDGYTFFEDGKASSLRLGVSTKEDVRKLFGSCRSIFGQWFESCDYDSNWLIDFEYLDEKHARMGTSELGSNGEIINKEFVLNPNFAGRIGAVHMLPKKLVSFDGVVFSAAFSKSQRKQSRTRQDKSVTTVTFCTYSDEYGLEYQVFENERLPDGTIYYGNPTHYLMSIKYSIPLELDQTLYLEKK